MQLSIIICTDHNAGTLLTDVTPSHQAIILQQNIKPIKLITTNFLILVLLCIAVTCANCAAAAAAENTHASFITSLLLSNMNDPHIVHTFIYVDALSPLPINSAASRTASIRRNYVYHSSPCSNIFVSRRNSSCGSMLMSTLLFS